MPADVLQCHLRLTPWKSAHNLGLARARPNYLLLLLIVFFLLVAGWCDSEMHGHTIFACC